MAKQHIGHRKVRNRVFEKREGPLHSRRKIKGRIKNPVIQSRNDPWIRTSHTVLKRDWFVFKALAK